MREKDGWKIFRVYFFYGHDGKMIFHAMEEDIRKVMSAFYFKGHKKEEIAVISRFQNL
jgi:hypothetical protein